MAEILSIILAIAGVIASIIQFTSVDEKLLNVLSRFFRKLIPSIPSSAIRYFVFTFIGLLLGVAFVILTNYTLTGGSTTQKPPAKPINSEYSTYTSATDIPNFTTRLQWDNSVVVEHSISITLDVQPKNNSAAIMNLSQKFGSNYTFFLVAQLDTDGSTFTTVPREQMQQSINQGNLSFHWIATPLHTGNQAVDITVKGIWIPKNSNSKQIEYYLGSHIWHISVTDDSLQPVVFGQVNVSQVFGYFLSVFVSVAFLQLIMTTIGDRKKAKQQDAQSVATQPSTQSAPPTQTTVAAPSSGNSQQNTQPPAT